MVRIYLGDWLYNAGIVGLLRALGCSFIKDGKPYSLDGKLIEGVSLGENFVEVERELLKNYAGKFFKVAVERFLTQLLQGKKLKVPTEPSLKELQNLSRQLRALTKHFKTLEIELPKVSKSNLPEAREKLERALEKLNEFLESLPEEEEENLALKWLSKGFFPKKGGDFKSAPHRSKENFKKKVELPLFLELRPYEKRKVAVPCVICQERKAKEIEGKPLTFNTSVSDFAGLNKDAVNFLHLDSKISELPICEVCHLVLMSVPLGLIPSSENTFLFVNNSSSLKELFNDNQRFEVLLRENSNPFIEFFTEKVLVEEKEKAELSLIGIAVVELNLGSLPKVKSFNLPLSKAKLFAWAEFTELLKKLRKAYYKEGNSSESLLYRTVELILSDKVNFLYLYKLLRFYLSFQEQKSEKVTVNFYPYHVNVVNVAFLNYFKAVLGDRMSIDLSEKELWVFWHKGLELKEQLERAKAENKVNSLAFKLLNAVRTGDSHKFFDILLRVYSGLSLEVPSLFIKAMSNKETFKTAGYSFICGLLGKTDEGERNG